MATPFRPLTGLLHDLTANLIEAMETCYRQAGLDYRPRYTPIVNFLRANGPSSIRALSRGISFSHSAVSQSLTQMHRSGLIEYSTGGDRRERIVRLSAKAKAMLPAIERQWRATDAAAATLDAELGLCLPDILERVIAALEIRSFADRIEAAKKEL